jgi:hypothetical protein
VALRGFTNERGEFLITTLPVRDLSLTTFPGPAVLPHFADGGGWTTDLLLVNATDSPQNGTIHFVNQSGAPVVLTANNQNTSIFSYSVPPRALQRLTTAGSSASPVVGSVRIIPEPNGLAPMPLAVFSFRQAGVIVSEAGVPATGVGTAVRLYAEASGDFDRGAIGSMQTGIAITNASTTPATITLELTRLDGSSTGLTGGLTGSLVVPPNGQTAQFLNQIQGLTAMPLPFQGVLRISSTAQIAVIGLRARYNERNDLLITTIPPTHEANAAMNSVLFFPHIAEGSGYTTQFILYSGSSGQQASGSLRLYTQSGQGMILTLQ